MTSIFSIRDERPVRTAVLGGVAAALVLLASSSAPAAEFVDVRATPAGEDPPTFPAGFQLEKGLADFQFDLYLYPDQADASSGPTVCTDAGDPDGDETCGFELVLEGTGDVRFVGFVPAAGNNIVCSPGVRPAGALPSETQCEPATLVDSPTVMKLNGMNLDPAPRNPAYMKIGTFTVDTTGVTALGAIHVAEDVPSKRVTADLRLEEIQYQQVLSTNAPEPGSLLLLGSGALTLAVLKARRRSA